MTTEVTCPCPREANNIIMGKAILALQDTTLHLIHLHKRITEGEIPLTNEAAPKVPAAPTVAEIMQTYPELINTEVQAIHAQIEKIEQVLY